MSAVTKAHRERLAKLCALFSSDQLGERASAAAKADRFLKSLGVTWEEVLFPAPVEQQMPELGTWRQTCAECLERPGSLKAWEAGFLRDLPKFRRLSVKQRWILKEIADRVLARTAA